MPVSPDLTTMWRESFPRQQGETNVAFSLRCIQTLARTYQRHGFDYTQSHYEDNYMGRVVLPAVRAPDDRLMMPPDPPPLAFDGSSPPSTRSPLIGKGPPLSSPESPTPAPPAAPAPPATPQQAQGQQSGNADDYEWDDIYGATPLQSPEG